ncbi:MAG: response regulator [Anaerolineales bacterium]|nr:response regulator [Anaerolineales bacterium]
MNTPNIYQELFEFNTTPSAVFDMHGRCVLANHAFINLLGVERSELLEDEVSFASFFSNPKTAHDILDELNARPVIRRREITLCDREGTEIPLLFSSRKFEIDGVERFEFSLSSLADQKRLERALRRDHIHLASLLESLSVGLFLIDQNNQILSINLPLTNLLNLDQERLINQHYRELFARILAQAHEPEVVHKALDHAVTSLVERPSIEIVSHDEQPRNLELSLFPVWEEDGTPVGWGGLVQDVTESRNRLAWKLDLLSMLAHDIRTPLATLKGHTTALLANYTQWSHAMVLEFLEVLDHTTDDLSRQVDTSLSLTRAEAGQLGLRPESIAPEELIHQALERAAALLENHPVQLDIPHALPSVRVDPARIEEVLINLIDNACQYSDPGKPIRIEADVEENLIAIRLIDQGPGIPREKQHIIFDKYVRDSNDQSGYGLGLFIARKIVEAHGGKIWLKSPLQGENYGSAFAFSLPIMPDVSAGITMRDAQALDPHATDQASAQGERVLVIEDNPDQQALLHALLTQEGYSVEITSNGPASLDIIQTAPPEIVLLDWVLPGMSGPQVCRALRRWSDIPILLVTSKTSPADLVLALDAGADDYIAKPFQSQELFARMRALRRRRLQEIRPKPKRDRFHAEGILIDFDSRDVWIKGDQVHLTQTEFKILAHLARNRGKVVTHDQLISTALSEPSRGTRHDVFVHISRLRKKTEKDPRHPRYILTRWGVGYIFLPD